MRFISLLFRFFVSSAICGIIIAAMTLVIYSQNLPDVKNLKKHKPDLVSKIYASNGQLLEEYSEEYRLFTPIDKIPKKVIYAFLAAEDADFYYHHGIDLSGIGRAIIQNAKNLVQKKPLVGGSSITQQVVKNLLLTREKSLDRKIKEAILSIRIENELSKDEILELYLNHIFLGNRSYGITSAAKKYFNKSLDELTLDEAALIASLPKAPSYYNPNKHPLRIVDRRNWVLIQMHEKEFIDKETMLTAYDQPIKIAPKSNDFFKAGYFTNEIRNLISKKYGPESLFKDGLIINTTLIPEIQKTARESLRKGILQLDKKIKKEREPNREYSYGKEYNPEVNGGLVIIHNDSGRVVSLVGGYDFYQSQFNRVTQSERQSGSVFKSFVYLSALEQGMHPAEIIHDMPVIISQGKDKEKWMPKNYSDDFLGKITLRKSLELSRNVSTVRLAQKIGLKNISDISQKLNISKKPINNLSSVLGATETKLIDIVSAYASIASGGKKIKPIFIDTIQNREGKIIFSNPNMSCIGCNNPTTIPRIIDHKEQVISPGSAYQMTHMLKGSVKRGTSKKAKILGINLAAKTGTTNENKDVWFIAFTPEYTIGAYVGYDSPKSLGRRATGATVAAPIIIDLIKNNRHFFKDRPFKTPEEIRMIKIDYDSGLLPNENTKRVIFEAFKKDQEPDEFEEKPSNSKEIKLRLESGQIY